MTSKISIRPRSAALSVLVLVALLISASARNGANVPQGAQATPPPQTIYFTAQNAGNFNTFIELVKSAGLVDTLKGAGPFTVFAPTDEAFAKLPANRLEDLRRPENKEKLKDLLTTHIFPLKATAAELNKLKDARTLRRNTLRLDAGNSMKIGTATITQADINASNGVIHAIDAVLLPEEN